MRMAVLGTGSVGRALSSKLAPLGHEVVMGTRDVDALMARTDTGYDRTPPFAPTTTTTATSSTETSTTAPEPTTTTTATTAPPADPQPQDTTTTAPAG